MRSLIAGAALLILASGYQFNNWRSSQISVAIDSSPVSNSLELPVLDGDYDEGPALLYYNESAPVDDGESDVPAVPKTYRI